MYPTVNSLMGLWRFVTAREIVVVEHCQKEIIKFLQNVSANYLFGQNSWKNLAAFVQIIPDGDILPSRSKYTDASNDLQVGVNNMFSDPENQNVLWYSLPDIVASVILTGRIPKIIDAFRLQPRGKSTELKPIRLRGSIEVDPRQEDFFKVVIEERKRLATRVDISQSEKERLDKALKIIANATSYGIYAEMNRASSEAEVDAVCYGIDPNPFTCVFAHPEIPVDTAFLHLLLSLPGAHVSCSRYWRIALRKWVEHMPWKIRTPWQSLPQSVEV